MQFEKTETDKLNRLKKYTLFAALLVSSASHGQLLFADNQGKLLHVGDTIVKRIMPAPETDSQYVATDYTEVHFRLNKATLDLDYMNNGKSLMHLDRVLDSLGLENITAVEVISQSSPEGTLARNQWLTENRSKVISDYLNRVFPQLKDKITLNKVTESWENLARYVAQDPYLEEQTINRILDIIESDESVAKKKVQMQNLGSDPKTGDIYAYLCKYYYPVIRNSGIYILHMVQPKTILIPEPEKPYAQVPQEPKE